MTLDVFVQMMFESLQSKCLTFDLGAAAVPFW